MRTFAISFPAGITALLIAAAANAGPGTLTMSWNGCNTSPITNLTVTAGMSSGVNLDCFLTGQSDPSTAYQVQVLYGDANHLVPDAWRFDAAGCQGSGFVIVNTRAPAALSKTCPSFQDAGGVNASLFITDVSFYPSGHSFPSTMMRISAADSYPTGNIPVGANKYFLMDAEFNQTFGSVGPTPPDFSTCGGLEDGICFHIISASYLLNSPEQTEIPFQIGSGGFISANAAGGACLVDPARPATWGSIKAQYRK